VGSKPQNNIASLPFKGLEADKIATDTAKKAKSEDKMDVTALMELLDKNRKNQSADVAANSRPQSSTKKPTFAQISTNITNSGVHTPDNANEPLFSQHPLRHTVIVLVIIATILGFIGMLYVVDNKADDWFINASGTPTKNNDLGELTPAAGGTILEERIFNDRILAENPVATNSKPKRETPTFAPVDDQELLRLLSKPARDQ
jgi:hypothetical protein